MYHLVHETIVVRRQNLFSIAICRTNDQTNRPKKFTRMCTQHTYTHAPQSVCVCVREREREREYTLIQLDANKSKVCNKPHVNLNSECIYKT